MSDMKGKICMVTGANAGIGKQTALELAKMGATVVLVCRNRARGEAAQAEIRQVSGNDQVDLLLADLSSQQSIHELAKTFKEKYDRLHVLVNNAGAWFQNRQLSVDGIEMTFALNHLGYFLLTHLLLDVLVVSAPSRIVNVSSGAHHNGRIHFEDLQFEKRYRGFAAYSQSKLANILFTYELARRLEAHGIQGVTVNCLHPGFVASNFGRNNGLLAKVALTFLRPIAVDVRKGAETSVYLASSPEVEGVTGKYFDKKKAVRSSAISYDEEVARRLWEISEEMTGVKTESLLAEISEAG
ncbi:MAG: SDR family oxidoreductase [Chloroflexi bacterium]|nr:MAG: SDR family oxidoreductase [Chloroflexota bacterium]